MKLVINSRMALLSLAVVLCLSGLAYGQSLAELARQQREKKKQQPASRTKVYTNSDIPEPALAGAPPAETTAQPEAAKSEGEKKEAGKPGAPKEEEKSQAELEKQYRDQFAKLRENQDTEERRLDVLQRELNLAQQQYYPDPNKALQEQNTRAEINQRTADIEKQKAVVDKAKQAIADLEEELRTKGLPTGWAR
jgi:hypothetical protein